MNKINHDISIGIDISLNSTAIVIKNKNDFKFISARKPGIVTKKLEDDTTSLLKGPIHYINVIWDNSKDYSENELLYLRSAKNNVNCVTEEIKTQLNGIYPESIRIEAYSMGLRPGSIIQIVSFSTLLRMQLIEDYPETQFKFIPPASLKKDVCGYTYGFDKKGKTVSPEGLSGGRFEKIDMLKALIYNETNTNIISDLGAWLKIRPEILQRASIPKPIDDLVDAYWLTKI